MVECRIAQDRISTLLVEINRQSSAARSAVRSQKALAEITKGQPDYPAVIALLRELEDNEDAMRYLLESAKSTSSNLRMTSSDIRLLHGIMEQQIRMGESYPDRRTPSSVPPMTSMPSSLPPIDPNSDALNVKPSSIETPIISGQTETEVKPESVVQVRLEDQELAEIDAFLGVNQDGEK